jgi:ABC-type lipoprotein release transport system permease subunit
MTFGRLLLRNLFYHWRGNSAVLLGVAVGTAVLTGALLVGDSLRGSLRAQVLEQLGWVDRALIAGRFVRDELASQLGGERACPAILLRGAATKNDEAGKLIGRAGQVTILGVDDRFWFAGAMPGGESFWKSDSEEVVLNRALADELGAQTGTTVTLHLQKVSAVPRESLLGRRDASEVIDSLKLTVREIIPNEGLGQFTLNPSLEVPRNAFVPLRLLQTALHQDRRANALLVGGGAADLQSQLGQHLTLDDWGLILREPKEEEGRGRGYLSLESRQMLVELPVADAAERAAAKQDFRTAPTLVYLANTITDGSSEIPYSVVAALDPSALPPLGPFLPPGVNTLKDDEIVLVDWKESPLKPKPGAKITLRYFKPEDEGRLPEVSAAFTFSGWVALSGPANDPHLTPDFPGITDKLTIRDWNPPFPFENNRVQRRDERYWDEYRTTPKAYITLAAGQKLWSSRFGHLTSIRLAPAPTRGSTINLDLTEPARTFQAELLKELRPEQGGLVFDAVRDRGLHASVGGTDFGEYFLYFSFFIIVSALLLVGLLMRLNLDRRGSEIGLLLACGFRRSVPILGLLLRGLLRARLGWVVQTLSMAPASVRNLLLAEGSILAAVGGVLGALGAYLYAWLLLELLRAWWPAAMNQSFLRLHATPRTFLLGYFGALVVMVLTILWAVRVLGRMSPVSLLGGETTASIPSGESCPRARWSGWIAAVAAVGALALMIAGRYVHDAAEQAETFLGSGALGLVAFLAVFWTWMRTTRHRSGVRPGLAAVARLGVRNAARHPVRSMLTVGLVAAAVFLIVSVESFHRTAGIGVFDPKSGTGGFTLLAESNVPLYQDLNSEDGRSELNFSDRATTAFSDMHVYSFRYRSGEDASCLNLYQPTRPRLLGVPSAFETLGRFRFKDSEARTPEQKENPWKLLELTEDDFIPAIVDATTATYILKKKLGDTVEIPNERGEPKHLRIVALLAESIFQSQMLISEVRFLELYPSHEGYSFFLIDTPADRMTEVKTLLETTLAERGFEATWTARRLESYWAVENTYLATFQALGGLGLVLGALGLAVVLLRTVWERRGELALLRALGYRRCALGWLMLAEIGLLLALGLTVGTFTALLAVLPHLASEGGEVPWLRLAGLVAAVLVIGLAAATAAVATSLRAPLVPALRGE